MPTGIKKRIMAALTLTPAIFTLAVWMLVLSSGQYIQRVGVINAVLAGAVLSFVMSYFITLFMVAMRRGAPGIDE